MLNHGVPVIVVSRRLGHAKASITLDVYGHLMPGMDAEAAEIMDELVTPIQLHQIAPRLHPIFTRTYKTTLHPPIYSPNKRKTPIPGGNLVGGIGLEPTTFSV